MIEYQNVNTVPGSTITTILSFTNTLTSKLVDFLFMEGNGRAEWTIYHNLNLITKRRTSVSEMTNKLKMFSFPLAIGDIIDIKVEHFGLSTNNFSGTIKYEEG